MGELVDYEADGYRSFTYHYKGAESNIAIRRYYDAYYYVAFGNNSVNEDFLNQYEDLLHNYRDVKIVLLDQNFRILLITRKIQLPKDNNWIGFDGAIYYDAANDSAQTPSSLNLYYAVFGSFFVLIFMLLSICAEMLVARIFGLKGKKLRMVCVVNLCTQIGMRLLYMVLPFGYFLETVILEILVYGVEFAVYAKRLPEMGRKRAFVYTVCANTVSLLLGILLDRCILA